MSDSNETSSTVETCPLSFLEQNPAIADSLLSECNYDLDQVKTVVEPALKAKDRCQASGYYIQATVTRRTTLLATNLSSDGHSLLTSFGSHWLVGRHSTCALTIKERSVSRCHALIGYHPTHGFSVTDLGSSNGTWLNGRKLPPHQRRFLKDGNLLQFGSVQVEFFVNVHGSPDEASQELTCSGLG